MTHLALDRCSIEQAKYPILVMWTWHHNHWSQRAWTEGTQCGSLLGDVQHKGTEVLVTTKHTHV